MVQQLSNFINYIFSLQGQKCMPRETYFTVYLKLYLIIKIKKNLPYLSISFEI